MNIPFHQSYLGQLRALVGSRRLLAPGFRILLERDDGAILFVRRSDNGKWAFPAGHMELGESMPDCIRRETFEETSLRVDDFECFGLASDPATQNHSYPNGDEVQSVVILVSSRQWAGLPQINDAEVSEFQFFSPTEAPPVEERVEAEFLSVAALQRFRQSGRFQWL